MKKGNEYRGIDPYAAALIKNKARKLVGHAGFGPDDLPDIEQELMLDLLRRIDRYDSERASFRTFIARLVEHCIATLVERQKAGLRDYRLRADLPNQTFHDNSHSPEVGDFIDQLDAILYQENRVGQKDDELHLSFDVARTIADLPEELRELCRDLVEKDLQEIMKEKSISRTTLYREVRKLRTVFQKVKQNK